MTTRGTVATASYHARVVFKFHCWSWFRWTRPQENHASISVAAMPEKMKPMCNSYARRMTFSWKWLLLILSRWMGMWKEALPHVEIVLLPLCTVRVFHWPLRVFYGRKPWILSPRLGQSSKTGTGIGLTQGLVWKGRDNKSNHRSSSAFWQDCLCHEQR